MTIVFRSALLPLLTCLCACLEVAPFACTASVQCETVDPSGVCEASVFHAPLGPGNSGVCSYMDVTCDGGRRYDSESGEPRARQCLPCGASDEPCCGGGRCDMGLTCRSQRCACVGMLGVASQQTCAIDAMGGLRCIGAVVERPNGTHGNSVQTLPIQGLDAIVTFAFDKAGSVLCATAPTQVTACAIGSPAITMPVALPAPRELSVGNAHQVCGLGEDGAVTCVDPMTGVGKVPFRGASHLSVHGDQTCVLHRDRSVWCWGLNDHGQLGDGTLVDRDTPGRVTGLPPASAIATGATAACALAEDGTVWCWGDVAAGRQTPYPQTPPLLQPVQMPGLAHVLQIAVDSDSGCARDRLGVSCWGAGVLVGGRYSPAPVRMPGLPEGVEELLVGGDHACARKGAHVWCWGSVYANSVTGVAVIAAPTLLPSFCP